MRVVYGVPLSASVMQLSVPRWKIGVSLRCLVVPSSSCAIIDVCKAQTGPFSTWPSSMLCCTRGAAHIWWSTHLRAVLDTTCLTLRPQTPLSMRNLGVISLYSPAYL